jgi:hypothetical protein
VSPADYEWLYHLLVVTAGDRWKFRGATPSPAAFEAELWAGIHAQFVVTRADGRRAGIAGLYKSNLVAGSSHVFAVADSGAGAVVVDGARQMCDWAFEQFELNKLWFEIPEFNLDRFGALLRHGSVEGRLTNYDYRRGRFWDLLVVSISAEQWSTWTDRHRGVRAVSFTQAELVDLVDELWPIDSLGLVELLEFVESRLDHPLDESLVAGLDAGSAEQFATSLFERIAAIREAGVAR